MPSKLNRSPVLDVRPHELYKSASVGRPGGSRPSDRSPSMGRPMTERSPSIGRPMTERSPSMGRPITQTLNTSPRTLHSERISPSPLQPVHISDGSAHSGASSNTVLSDQNDLHVSQHSSFRGMPPQQSFAPSVYNGPRTVPVYIAHTPTSSFSHSDVMSFSQPVSRSTSRADSFKNTLGQLKVHTSDSYLAPMSAAASNILHGEMMETLAGNIGLSVYPVSQPYATPPSVVKHGSFSAQKNISASSSADFSEELMMTLPEASQEYLAPPPAMFADSMRETPDSSLSLTLDTSCGSSLHDQRSMEHSKSSSAENIDIDSDQVRDMAFHAPCLKSWGHVILGFCQFCFFTFNIILRSDRGINQTLTVSSSKGLLTS